MSYDPERWFTWRPRRDRESPTSSCDQGGAPAEPANAQCEPVDVTHTPPSAGFAGGGSGCRDNDVVDWARGELLAAIDYLNRVGRYYIDQMDPGLMAQARRADLELDAADPAVDRDVWLIALRRWRDAWARTAQPWLRAGEVQS